ncbi:hypothetical protein [Streptomyces sp. NPDC001948]
MAARRLPAVEEAMGVQGKALLVQLSTVCMAVDDLAKAVGRSFRTHPDAPVMLGFPGTGPGTGTRTMAVHGTAPGLRPTGSLSIHHEGCGLPGIGAKHGVRAARRTEPGPVPAGAQHTTSSAANLRT